MDPVASRLFVCYVPGLDLRRISAARAPFVAQWVESDPMVELATTLGTDHLPTLLTGVEPHEHRLWQVSLRPEARMSRGLGLTDRLPGVISTTLQSARRLVDRSYHLPTIPSRRRRQFDIHRTGNARSRRGTRAIESIGGYPTVFSMVADSRFLFSRRLEALGRLAEAMPSALCALEFLEVQALDVIQHWHMDAPNRVDRAYRAIDAFLRGLRARCEERGVTLVLLVDHGQEPVSGIIPLMRDLRSVRIAETDYNFLFEPALARFWFHTEEARARLTHVLREVAHTRLLTLKDLRGRGMLFEDDAYGDVFLAAEPGFVFFPNDHHHPLNNVLLGMCDPDQRPRVLHARLRGAHGYLPEHPSERGFAIVADRRFHSLRPLAELIDIAPTLLTLLGETPPAFMRGRPAFGSG
jgi:type I phosphodiesterase/nucleotide pyrophosphatase